MGGGGQWGRGGPGAHCGGWGPLTKLEVGVVGADVVAGAEQPLHHQRRAHGVEQPKVLGDAALLRGAKGENGGPMRPCSPRGAAPWLPISYQGVGVIAHERPVVVDLPLEDDEEEEQAQQDVAQVAEDVVEGAAGGPAGWWVLWTPVSPQGAPSCPPAPLNPPEVPQRVGAQKVVVADVLVAGDVHHLRAGMGRAGDGDVGTQGDTWDAGVSPSWLAHPGSPLAATYRLVGDDELDDREGVEDGDGGDVPGTGRGVRGPRGGTMPCVPLPTAPTHQK